MTFQPMDGDLLKAALEQFSTVSRLMVGVVGSMLTIRFVIFIVSFASVENYASLLKTAALYLATISIFPEALSIFMRLMADLSSAIHAAGLASPEDDFTKYLNTFSGSISFFVLPATIRDMGVLYLAQSIYGLLLSLLIAIGPVVLFFSLIANGPGATQYFGAILLLSIWPLTWNLLEALSAEIAGGFESTSLAKFSYFLVISLLKLCSPIFSVFLFRSLSVGEAVKRPFKLVTATLSTSAGFMGRVPGKTNRAEVRRRR